jgi:mannose-1-phosphate guanylyltransferase/mannose-1-phosphate guanylyltransferase/mannose-6-phosphate isomerase
MKELTNAQKDIRPWGNFERFTLNEVSTVKIITVDPNQSLSLQRHQNREEYWKILSGNGFATVQGDKKPITAGDSVFIPKLGEHRIESGDTTLVFLEIAFGVFDENDIERLDDKYGRV